MKFHKCSKTNKWVCTYKGEEFIAETIGKAAALAVSVVGN